MADSQQILNKLIETPNILNYVERVKKEYLDKYGVELDLKNIKLYMMSFLRQHRASKLALTMVSNVLDEYYNKDGSMRYGTN